MGSLQLVAQENAGWKQNAGTEGQKEMPENSKCIRQTHIVVERLQKYL